MNTTNTALKVVQTNKTGLNSQEITNGAIYYVTDTKEIYVDFNNSRTCFEDIIILNTDESRSSILFTPLNKFYYALDTNTLYLYKDGNWYTITSNQDLTNYLQKTDVDGTTIKLTNNKLEVQGVVNTNTGGGTLKYWSGTKAQYDAIQEKDANTIYYTTDETGVTIDSTLSASSENPVQNKVINTALGLKQDTISDLSTIRTNATNGASAYTTIQSYGDIVTHDANEFLTEHQDISGKADKSTTLSGYGITNAYTKTEIDGLVSSVYKPAGSVAYASLPTPSSSNLGNVYNVTDSFTTDSRFIEGAGKSYPAGTNVVIVNPSGSNYNFDVLSGFVDLSGYQLSSTAVTHTANTGVGNSTTPVYIANDGTATALSYTLAKSVPADAVFTDTTYSDFSGADGTDVGTSGLVPQPSATDNTKYLKGDGTWSTIPSPTVDQTYDGTSENAQSGAAIEGKLAEYVTTGTDQDITGVKTFVGQKKIVFKQSGNNDKLGFTLFNRSNVEKGYLEFNPTGNIDGYPVMTLGNYATAESGITQVGFRRYSNVKNKEGAYNLLMPLIADAKAPFNLTTTYTHFYLPLGFTDGTTTVVTNKSGLVDLSSIIGGSVTVDQTYNSASTNAQSGTAVAEAVGSKSAVIIRTWS